VGSSSTTSARTEVVPGLDNGDSEPEWAREANGGLDGGRAPTMTKM
jgi:hypothetical protein